MVLPNMRPLADPELGEIIGGGGAKTKIFSCKIGGANAFTLD